MTDRIKEIDYLILMLPCGIDEYSDIHYMRDNRKKLKAALSVLQKMASGEGVSPLVQRETIRLIKDEMEND